MIDDNWKQIGSCLEGMINCPLDKYAQQAFDEVLAREKRLAEIKAKYAKESGE